MKKLFKVAHSGSIRVIEAVTISAVKAHLLKDYFIESVNARNAAEVMKSLEGKGAEIAGAELDSAS